MVGEKKERRGVRVLSQGTTRAPWRLRHWVHWQVWVWGWGEREGRREMRIEEWNEKEGRTLGGQAEGSAKERV